MSEEHFYVHAVGKDAATGRHIVTVIRGPRRHLEALKKLSLAVERQRAVAEQALEAHQRIVRRYYEAKEALDMNELLHLLTSKRTGELYHKARAEGARLSRLASRQEKLLGPQEAHVLPPLTRLLKHDIVRELPEGSLPVERFYAELRRRREKRRG
jgi:hypothetical protein